MKLMINGRPLGTDQITTDDHGAMFIDLKYIKSNLGAMINTTRNDSQVVICLNDHCVTWGPPDLLHIHDRTFIRIDSLTTAFGLHHEIRDDTVVISTTQPRPTTGLSVGDTPPTIELPNIDTGLTVRSTDFQGQRTIFFMWASW